MTKTEKAMYNYGYDAALNGKINNLEKLPKALSLYHVSIRNGDTWGPRLRTAWNEGYTDGESKNKRKFKK